MPPNPLTMLVVAVALLTTGCNLIHPLARFLGQDKLEVSWAFICPFDGVEILFEAQPTDKTVIDQQVLDEVADILRSRLEDLTLSEAAVVPLPPNQVLAQLGDGADFEKAMTLLTQNGKLTFQPQKKGTSEQLNSLQIQLSTAKSQLSSLQTKGDQQDIAKQKAVTKELIQKLSQLFEPSNLTGRNIKGAIHQSDGPNWSVVVQFDEQGSQAFAELTKTLAATDRSLGIFLGGQLLSNPTVSATFAETGIQGGNALIAGNFTETKAEILATQIRSGVLPAEIKLISQQTTKSDRCQTNA